MRALQCMDLTGPDALELREVDPPSHGGQGVLIDVHATGIAFPDLLLTRGEYQMKLEPPFTPGVECAGVVAFAPEDSGFAVGDRVMAATYSGGLADQVVAAPMNTFAVPDGMTMEQAGGFIMNYHTAHFAFHRRGRLQAGETVLVHGAAGGVGTAAIQIAKGAGATVVGVGSTSEKRDAILALGADHAVPAHGFRDAVREVTDGRGVDVVLDVVGEPVFLDSLRSLAPEGRLLVVGFAGGGIPQVKVNRLLLNNVSVVGVGWGAFLVHEPTLSATIAADLDRLHAEGVVDPLVGPVFDLADGADAIRALDERAAIGKVVVRVAGP